MESPSVSITPARDGEEEAANGGAANDLAYSLSQELSMKHPLQHSWTLWYYKNDRSKSWEDNLREVVTFNSVEDFWSVYNHIELASRLGPNCDYSIFKEDIKPMWEDKANMNGGRWLINLDKKHRSIYLDTFWLEVLLCLIGSCPRTLLSLSATDFFSNPGESFGEDGHIVNGAVVSIRNRGDKIGVWLGNAKMASSIMHVGKELKARLGLSSSITLGFEAHEDTMHKSGSTAKSKFVV